MADGKTTQLDDIEVRQLRMEKTIEAINEQIGFLIQEGVLQTKSRFQGRKQEPVIHSVGIVATAQ